MDELSYVEADARFEQAIRNLKAGGKVPKLNSFERQLLEFCHGRDMKKFLKEEFEKHPIHLNDDGELIGENPFDKERNGGQKPYLYEDAMFGYHY